jgi:hypothetical protein
MELKNYKYVDPETCGYRTNSRNGHLSTSKTTQKLQYNVYVDFEGF